MCVYVCMYIKSLRQGRAKKQKKIYKKKWERHSEKDNCSVVESQCVYVYHIYTWQEMEWKRESMRLGKGEGVSRRYLMYGILMRTGVCVQTLERTKKVLMVSLVSQREKKGNVVVLFIYLYSTSPLNPFRIISKVIISFTSNFGVEEN